MSQAAVIQAIRDRFDGEVADVADLLVVHDNAPTPPAYQGTWCRFSVRIDSASQVSVGVRRWRYVGVATAQLFRPLAKGDAALLALADDVVEAFRGATIPSLMVAFMPSPSISGQIEPDAGWANINVSIPFRADVVS